MVKANIVVIDSGIGGLSVLKALDESLHSARFFYVGDNGNAPYGNRPLHNLWSHTIDNLVSINGLRTDLLVLGCNTLSVNLLPEIEDFMGVKTIGVFPPVESAMIDAKNVLLLSTVSTANKYKKTQDFYPLGLPSLASEVEKNVFSIDKINLSRHLSTLMGLEGSFDTVILGCTHFEFIKNKISNHLKPQKILSGVDFTVSQVIGFLQNQKTSVKDYNNEVFFVGENARYNKKIYNLVVKYTLKK